MHPPPRLLTGRWDRRSTNASRSCRASPLRSHPRVKKAGRCEAACIERFCPSTYMGDALLGICFDRGRWLCWQLKHRCFLTLAQCCQENDTPIRKFERIVVLHRFVLIHLTEDCRHMAQLFHLPPDEAGACNCNCVCKRKFGSWENANCHSCIFRRSETACDCSEVSCSELVANLRRS